MRLAVILVVLLGRPALADIPRVMTDVPAVHSLAAQVMGDLGTPGILLDRGADAHHFQLRPTQARALSQADLVFWVGPELTPWLERALDGIGGEAQSVPLREMTNAHEPEDEDAHANAHDHDAIHAWLDPGVAGNWVDEMAHHLSGADPDNAAVYAANARQAKERIAATARAVEEILAPVGEGPIVTYHDAYGPFADAFGLIIAGSIAEGDAAAPGAGRLFDLRAMLADSGAVCVFPETQQDPALVRTVTEGTNARIGAALDPSGSTLEYGPDLYSELLTTLARRIADCAAGR